MVNHALLFAEIVYPRESTDPPAQNALGQVSTQRENEDVVPPDGQEQSMPDMFENIPDEENFFDKEGIHMLILLFYHISD